MTQAAFEAALLVLLTWGALLSVRAGLFDVSLEAKFATGIVATLFAWRLCPDVLRQNLLLAGILGAGAASVCAAGIGHVYGWLVARKKLDPIVSGVALNVATIPLAALAYSAWYRPWEILEPANRNLSRQLTDLYSDQVSAAWIISLVVIFASAALAWWINNTATGTQLMASGLSMQAAIEAGIDVSGVRAKAARWSGYFCGLAGALYVYFISPSSFTADSMLGRGFLALAVTLIARRSVFAVCCVAFVLGSLRTGSQLVLRGPLAGRVAESAVGYIADAAPFFMMLLILLVARRLPRLAR